MKIDKKLILYRSSRHQLPLKTNIKYGLIPNKIKVNTEDNKSRKCQERMIKAIGRKYIQAIDFLFCPQSEIDKRVIFCLVKLVSFKTITFEHTFTFKDIDDHTTRKLAFMIFSRYKHVQSFSSKDMHSLVTFTEYLKPLQFLTSTKKLSFPSITIISPTILNQLANFFLNAYKRRIWPKLKIFLTQFILKFGMPFSQDMISSLKNLFQTLKNPQFCQDPQVELQISAFHNAPVDKNNCEFSDIVMKSKLVSSLQVFFVIKFADYFESLLKTLQTSQLQSLSLVNMDRTHSQGVPLIPVSIAQFKSLKSLELKIGERQNMDCLLKTFEILAHLENIQAFSLTFRDMIFDIPSLKAMSNLLVNWKSLQNLSLYFNYTGLRNLEARPELSQFLKDLGSCTHLKEFILDWTGTKYDYTKDHNYNDYFLALCGSLQSFQELKILEINYGSLSINNGCVQRLSQVLLSAADIQSLNISVDFDKGIVNENLLELIKSIENLRNLSELTLDLAIEKIDDKFTETLENVIRSLKSLSFVKINLRNYGSALEPIILLRKMVERFKNTIEMSIRVQ